MDYNIVIKTNNHKIAINPGIEYDVAFYKKNFDNHFDSFEDFENQAKIIEYSKMVFDLSDFIVFDPDDREDQDKSPFAGWDGHYGLTAFSGVLIKLLPNDECIMGYYYQKS